MPAASRFQAQVSSHFLKCSFHVPATAVHLNDFAVRHRRVSTEEVFVAMRPVQVAYKHPPKRNQSLAALEPVTGT